MIYTKSSRHDGCWDVEQEDLGDEHDPEPGHIYPGEGPIASGPVKNELRFIANKMRAALSTTPPQALAKYRAMEAVVAAARKIGGDYDWRDVEALTKALRELDADGKGEGE